MGHGHDPADSPRLSFQQLRTADTTTRAVWVMVLVAATLTVVGAVVLWPSGGGRGADPMLLDAGSPLDAHVVSTTRQACTGSAPADPQQCVVAVLHVDGAPTPPATSTPDARGSGAPTPSPPATLERGVDPDGHDLRAGDDILVTATVLPNGTITYAFFDYQRSTPMLALVAILVGVVVVIGRWRGLGALAGLAVSLVVLVGFVLPSLLDGHSPVLVAVVGASAIAFFALYLAQGVTVATSVALLGTFASLGLTALLSWIFIDVTELTGRTEDSAYFLDALGGHIDLRGILLAGFVIGALGVLDDITVTQVSAVNELRTADPTMEAGALFRSAMNIGRDHISSTVNTLFLAYAGAALPLLLLFTEAHQPITSIAGREVVATEIIRSLVGSIGLVAAVPITTWLAVRSSTALTFVIDSS